MKKKLTTIVPFLAICFIGNSQPQANAYDINANQIPNGNLYSGSATADGTTFYVNDDSTISKIYANGSYGFIRSYKAGNDIFSPEISVAFSEGVLACLDVNNDKLMAINNDGDVSWMLDNIDASYMCKSHSNNILLIERQNITSHGSAVHLIEIGISNGNVIQHSTHVIPNANFANMTREFITLRKTQFGYFAIFDGPSNVGEGDYFLSFSQNLSLNEFSEFDSTGTYNWEFKDGIQSAYNGHNIYLIADYNLGPNDMSHLWLKLDANHNLLDKDKLLFANHTMLEAGANHRYSSFVETPNLTQHYWNGAFYEDVKDYQDGSVFSYITYLINEEEDRIPAIIQFAPDYDIFYCRMMNIPDAEYRQQLMGKTDDNQLEWIIKYVESGVYRMDYKLAGDFSGCFLEDVNPDVVEIPIQQPIHHSFYSFNQTTPDYNEIEASYVDFEVEHYIKCEQGQPKAFLSNENNIEGLDDINIYPNPTNGLLYFELGGENDFTITVLDISGRTCISETTAKDFSYLDLSNLNDGIYLIRFFDKTTGITKTKKIQLAK